VYFSSKLNSNFYTGHKIYSFIKSGTVLNDLIVNKVLPSVVVSSITDSIGSSNIIDRVVKKNSLARDFHFTVTSTEKKEDNYKRVSTIKCDELPDGGTVNVEFYVLLNNTAIYNSNESGGT
jgi:hypothetical protein